MTFGLDESECDDAPINATAPPINAAVPDATATVVANEKPDAECSVMHLSGLYRRYIASSQSVAYADVHSITADSDAIKTRLYVVIYFLFRLGSQTTLLI